MNKKKIFVSCTEQSGDNICHNILQKLDLKNLDIDGICGSRSQKYFKKKYFDISNFKSIGLFEIIFSITKYIKMINYLKSQILVNKYDLIICIDSPDFNYHLVKSLRKRNYSNTIIHIVAPTVWAWRKKRAKKFANIFNEIFLLFKFEKDYFNFPNFTSTFIGHPIFHTKKRNIKNEYKYIAFLFGSRENEINKLFKYFNILENYISSNNLKWKIFIPTLPHLTKIIKNKTQYWNTETLISNNFENFDIYYDDVFVSVTCSGTASLEIAKRNIPQIVIYKLNYLTELLLSFIVNVRKACLLNIISNKEIIPELVNSNLTKSNLLNSFEKLLNDKSFRSDQIRDINNHITEIVSNESPFEISARRLKELL